MALSETWTYDLTNTTEGHNKFWRARVEGKTLFVEYGRIGARGTTTVKAFKDNLDASYEMHFRAREKLGNGYKQQNRFDYRPTVVPVPQYLKAPPPPPYVQPIYHDVTAKELPAYRATELNKMPDGFFVDLHRRVLWEARRREETTKVTKAEKNSRITKLQNFLLGVAHAMACRAALRWSAGHQPFGKVPMHGLPWNAYDGTKLCHMINEGGTLYNGVYSPNGMKCYSNPMTWKTKGDLEHWLAPAYAGRTRYWEGVPGTKTYNISNAAKYLH